VIVMNPTDSASEGPALSPLRVGALSVAAALTAAAISWLATESGALTVPAKRVPLELNGQIIMATTPRTEQAGARASAALQYGAFGALLGLALGAAGGVAGRSAPRGVVGALTGLVVGAVAGAGTSYAGLPIF
jgi:hypothetical protein